MVTPGAANRGDVLVDGHAFHIRARFAGVPAGMVDPARMVDQHVERRVPAVEETVQFETCIGGVITTLRLAEPLAMTELGEAVVGVVQGGQHLAGHCRADHEIPAQVEFVVDEGRRERRDGNGSGSHARHAFAFIC